MMFSLEENPKLLDALDPEPGWSGLYDPVNGRRNERNIYELFPPDELYYSTELTDNEDEDHGSLQQEEAQGGGDDNEVYVRSPCRDRSPSPPMRGLSPIWGPSLSRSPSPLRSAASTRPRSSRSRSPNTPPATRRRVHFNPSVVVFGQPSAAGYTMIPLQYQGIKRWRDEEDNNEEAPPSRKHCMNYVLHKKSRGLPTLNLFPIVPIMSQNCS
ncbi:uncharacterized protein LOC113648757 [Tachysurus fulvidraco]|uniref:uncharacterized protein LOC113648757 n=1 Tax=Tachysurus fulvidraco TaxID=1234273 RepID=UPI001FEF802B|nr:uncharacterized protein LOC113648757 [Tachysurus fulvidraco]